ncbi:MAG: PDZ domain-containing protein [Myxococcota bacterium]
MSTRPPSRQQLRGLAMIGGLMLGLGLLSLMRPGGDRPPPVHRTYDHAPREPGVQPPPTSAPAPAPPTRRLRQREAAPAPSPPEEPPVDPDAPVEVGFEIQDAEGRPLRAMLEPLDCPGIRFTSVTSFEAPPGPCVVRAVRQDGLLTARGEPVELWVRPGTDQSFEVPMEAPPRGGVGVQFRGTPEGMRVDQVLPDTPADRAGLEPGDLIVEVEGASVLGLPIEDFVAELTGPEGSDVEFTVEYTTDTGTTRQRLLVTRERLGS